MGGGGEEGARGLCVRKVFEIMVYAYLLLLAKFLFFPACP